MPADASDALVELDAKIAAWPELHLLGQHWDPETGIITFADGDDVYVRARAILIGSWARSGSWRWAWPNTSLPAAARNASLPLKALGERGGRAEFLQEDAFRATSGEAKVLAAEACRHLHADAACTAGSEQAVWWFTLHGMEHLRPLEPLTERAAAMAADVLTQGLSVSLLNALRARFPALRLNLIGRDLRGAAQPWAHDLHAQILFDYDALPSRQPRDFSGADLSHARFDDAILRGSDLHGASFEEASLVDTDLSRADLRGVSFRGAFLNGTNFSRAQLAGADFTGAELSRTLLVDVDLSQVKGLDAVRHVAPSEISLGTLSSSRFQLSPVFLRRSGVSRGLIEDLARGQRVARAYETCFLSYSSKDKPFAEQLYQSLADAGVRVFWDYFDVLPGESLREQIVEAIREHDRLVVVLSPHAMASAWVGREVQLAWTHKRESLVPVRLCDIALVPAWTAAHPDLPELAALAH
jgi:uncharacterized protein YjbI with pentapeptide repeats